MWAIYLVGEMSLITPCYCIPLHGHQAACEARDRSHVVIVSEPIYEQMINPPSDVIEFAHGPLPSDK